MNSVPRVVRILASYRQVAPAMPLACGVVLAQAVGWFIPLFVSLGGLVLIGGACGLWPHGRRGFFLGAMLRLGRSIAFS
jgi:hypothetical protein